ncbi:hypothetical protein [Roseateles puraquae]|uniref:hypothetical protein n=1 Tax=Roseateles puraquae TaxID=431059 RepID=UPI0031CE9C6D
MPKPPAYWFKAKSTGFGWSMPLTWQGWIVYIVLIGAIGHAVVFGENVGQKLLGTWIPILLALPVFWFFGEPLGGNKDGTKR